MLYNNHRRSFCRIALKGAEFMKIAAVISEYNPFHFGHKYLADKTREKSATHIVSVMSGNFVQRGDVAVFDKYARAKTALENGVDLVVELPSRFSLMSAEGFAKGAISIISALNCVEMLAFGSECGDISALKEASGAIEYCIHSEKFDFWITRGKSYPAALQEALREYYTEDVSNIISSPNNTLAIEYLNALDNIGSSIEPFTVKRLGAAHDAENDDIFASGTSIRRKILEGKDYSKFAPVLNEPTADIKRLETAVLAQLRMLRKEDFEQIYDCAGGLGERLFKAVRKAGTFEELLFLAKTKRYTLARVRRACMCGFLGITKSLCAEPPAYIHILGMNAKGREILSAADCKIPIDTSLKALSQTSRAALRQANSEARCGDIYSLAFEKPRACGYDFTAKPVILD